MAILFAWGLGALMCGGCVMPRYVIGLDSVLRDEGRDRFDGYGYRCTRGAHRGASEEFRENTLAALKAADTNDAFAFIEFDVQYAKDGRIVVFHDKRMFRLFGSMRAIGKTSFPELVELTDGEIAAYDEVMPVLRKKLNIEIKTRGDMNEDIRLVDEIVADVRNRRRERDVLISSISSDVVTYVNRAYPELLTGQVFWLTSSTYLHFETLTENLYEAIHETQADYLFLHVANLRNIDGLLRLKPKGKTVVFWDFDDTMYLVHKDLSDRLWGDSLCVSLCQFVWYGLVDPLMRQSSLNGNLPL